MRIKIAERLHPFSHVPGTVLMLPGTSFFLHVFPGLLRLYDIVGTLLGEVKFALTGPVHNFTIVQDLERLEVRVFGAATEGYFRYVCRAKEETVGLHMIKGNISFSGSIQQVLFPATSFQGERLSLGSHKAQDFAKIKERLKAEELFPLWFRLGMVTPKMAMTGDNRDLLGEATKMKTVQPFLNLFQAGFKGMFVPRREDDNHQGFALPPLASTLSPLLLLTEGARLIRSLFIEQKGNSLAILPALPEEFHAGRMTDIDCAPFGTLDLEWSKKQIRRLILRAESDGELQMRFQPQVKSFRFAKERMACGLPIPIKNGNIYLLDNFRH